MPVVLHPMYLREVKGCSRSIPPGVSTHRHYPHTLRIAAQAEHHGMQFFGGQRALIGTVRVEKCQNDRFTFELRERDRPAKLINQAKIWGRYTSKVRALQARLVYSCISTTRGYSPYMSSCAQNSYNEHYQ